MREGGGHDQQKMFVMGVMAALFSAMSSALMAVMSEKVLSNGRDSIFYTMELSIFGLLATALHNPATFAPGGSLLSVWAAWPALAAQGFGGVLVGVVTKRCGSLNKAIVMVMGLLLTGCLQVLLERCLPSCRTVCSISFVLAGLVSLKGLDQQISWKPMRHVVGCRTLLHKDLLWHTGCKDAWTQEYRVLK
ncbi:unnamed protein product [Effrenium voratum]|nr:unnamed protein product [Effrenium voratum]